MDNLFANFQYLSFDEGGWGWNLLRGLASTLQISLGAYLLGLIIGLAGAFGKINGSAPLKWMLEFFTTLMRAVPELVLILLIYYAGTSAINHMLELMGYRPVDISGLAAGIFVLGVVVGAYAIEVIRGAMLAVPRGQQEAAEAFGMSRWQVLRRITLPAMLPFALPGMSNLWLNVTKNTALLAVVGFSELALTTRQAAGTTRAYFMFFFAAALLYLIITLISNQLFHALEKHSRRGQPELT